MFHQLSCSTSRLRAIAILKSQTLSSKSAGTHGRVRDKHIKKQILSRMELPDTPEEDQIPEITEIDELFA